MNFFDLLDFATANLMLPLGGLLVAVFVGWRLSQSICRSEMGKERELTFRIWWWLVRYSAPLAVLVVFVANLYNKFGG